jgi:hypothetical protein
MEANMKLTKAQQNRLECALSELYIVLRELNKKTMLNGKDIMRKRAIQTAVFSLETTLFN